MYANAMKLEMHNQFTFMLLIFHAWISFYKKNTTCNPFYPNTYCKYNVYAATEIYL